MNGAIPLGDFVLGCALLATTLGCALGAAMIVVRRRLVHLRGSPRIAAISLLALAATLAVHLVPLALGVLSRATVVAASILLLVAVAFAIAPAGGGQSPEDEPDPQDRPPSSVRSPNAVSWLLAGAGLVLTVAYALAYLRAHAADHPVGTDALAFHLPGVIRFIQSGTMWQTTQYVAGQAHGNYPQYGDLMLLAAVLPWRSVALVRYVDPVLVAIAATCVYGIGRELRAPPPIALLAACSAIAVGPVLTPAFTDQMTDPTFIAGFAAGVLFLLRQWRGGSRSELVLAGAGLGIALGTKWYGLTDVPIVVAVWAATWLLSRRPWRGLIADGSVLAGTVALAGGVWLVRNLVLTGNPVFDYKVSLFGVTIFDAPADPVRNTLGFSIAHYAGRPGILRRYIWPVLRTDFGLAGGVVAAGAAVVLLLALARRVRGRRIATDARIALLAVGAVALALAYAVTPYGAQGTDGAPTGAAANTRYGIPALLVAAPLVAWLGGQLGRARPLLEALLVVAVLLGLRDHLATPTGQVVAAAVAVAAVLAAGIWLRRTRPGGVLAGGGQPFAVGLGAAAAVVSGAAAIGYHYQRNLASRPFVPDDPAVSYVLAHAPAGSRIGLTGEWLASGLIPVEPLFGPRLDNHLEYVGPFVRHLRGEYRTPSPFLAALRRGRFRYLVVGTGFPPVPHPQSELWAQSAGFVTVARSPRLIALRAPGT